MTLFQTSTDSWVLTRTGPLPAGQLRPGTQVWVLSSEGAFVAQALEEIGGPTPSRVVELLTKAGDVLVPENIRLAGSQGPLTAAEIRPGPRQLEVLRPGQAQHIFSLPTPLEGLTGLQALVPQAAGDPSALRAMLDQGGVAHTLRDESGWTVITVDRPGINQSWSWSNEAELLRQLTAWIGGEHRTKEDDLHVRRRLLWAMVAAAEYYDARWVPRYRPVECRVSGAGRADAFNTVVASRRRNGHAVSLRFRAASALLVDLAYALPM